MKEGDSVHKYIKLMTEIFNSIVHLRASLPDSYDMFVTELKASQSVPKWVLVTGRLLKEETKIRVVLNQKL